ncbi:MAG: PhoH family protein, partial [Gemmatimonadaceae bacterium]
MPDETVAHRISTDGADLLTLAGVNDANLVELARVAGVKVGLRGDTMTLTGSLEHVERAVGVAQRMIDTAKQRMPLSPDDVMRLSEDGGGDNDGTFGGPRIALPGVRRVIQPKTTGQAAYLQLMADNDIVIGIGPA